jgi:hypothetical protein
MLAQARCAEAGVCLPELRNLVCRVMIVILPASMMAQDATRGLLYSDGGTWLNEVQAPPVAAVFPDSLVQTQAGHMARIEVAGSSVVVAPETMMQFQGHELALDHGSLQLDTSTEMEVIVGCITISPVSYDKTQYEVTDGDGKVRVDATRGDVKVHSHGAVLQKSKRGESSDTIVHQGENATRPDQCAALNKPSQGVPGFGPGLDSPWAVIPALVVAGTLICLGLCHGQQPISPMEPQEQTGVQ